MQTESASDRLNSSVRNGEMSLATCLSSGTDNESAAELLSGSFMIPATTSLTGIVENDDRATPCLAAVNVGSGAPAEPDLIAATLSTKKLLNSSTVIAELAGSRPRPSSVSTEVVYFFIGNPFYSYGASSIGYIPTIRDGLPV